VPAVGIPHPLGDPAATTVKEKTIRRGLVERALRAVASSIETQTIFDTWSDTRTETGHDGVPVYRAGSDHRKDGQAVGW